MRNWNAARVFTHKEIKAATNNFKEVIGRGSFGSVYFGRLSDGKMVAVKVRFDRSQLGADSFINEVHHLNSFSILLPAYEAEKLSSQSYIAKGDLYLPWIVLGESIVSNSASKSCVLGRVLS